MAHTSQDIENTSQDVNKAMFNTPECISHVIVY